MGLVVRHIYRTTILWNDSMVLRYRVAFLQGSKIHRECFINRFGPLLKTGTKIFSLNLKLFKRSLLRQVTSSTPPTGKNGVRITPLEVTLLSLSNCTQRILTIYSS